MEHINLLNLFIVIISAINLGISVIDKNWFATGGWFCAITGWVIQIPK
jgi:hypothetical protein